MARVRSNVDSPPTIVPLTERWSEEAGALIVHVLREEFSEAVTMCGSGELGDMAGYCREPGRNGWVAVSDGRVVGVATVRETENGALELKRLYTDASARGRGVGRALHETVEQWAGTQGYQQIVLTTTEAMVRARAFYEGLGYRLAGTTETGILRLYHYKRTLRIEPMGSVRETDQLPEVDGDFVAVLIERPRGYLEGWHWDERERRLVLEEYYDRPVPVNYGLAPDWRNPADGDALDVIVVDDRRMRPGETLVARPVGVLWRPDDDHKLLVEPVEGAERPIEPDAEVRARVSSWWAADDQPTGWSGIEGVPRLFAQCVRR